MANDNELQCYNRGCGQKYDPKSNDDESCRHHPGDPFFHDAYKGWSCCKKKCTDFTEFLNIQGCTLSKHSNIKPPEPEKPAKQDVPDTEVILVKPIVSSVLERPAFDSPLTTLTPEIAPSLKQQLNTSNHHKEEIPDDPNVIKIGTVCKNGGCGVEYTGPNSDNADCIHHPGMPVFHEGLKFWSCCTKRTTDFNAFLNQVGCETGKHVWKKDDNGNKSIQCRWDYHQTSLHVVVSVYAKQYCPNKSIIKLNPIRLYVNLVFPQESNGVFNLDLELRGIVNVDASEVSMYGTKVEIKMKKAEPGSWARLEIPRVSNVQKQESKKLEEKIIPQIAAVDLDDL